MEQVGGRNVVKEAERVAAAASAPTYEEMLATRGRPRTSPIHTMEPGVPVRWWRAHDHNGRNAAYVAAHKAGFRIAAKFVDGELWIVRLKPEDA